MSEFPILDAHSVALMSEQEIWTNLPPRFTLRFPDGDILTDDRRTQLSWYLWWPVRDYPATVMSKVQHLGAKSWTSKSVQELNDLMWWECFDQHGKSINPEIGAMRTKQEINRLHNQVANSLGDYVSSLDVLDFYDVINHPEIKEVNDHLQSLDQEKKEVRAVMDKHIANAHAEITRIMMSCPSLSTNKLVCAVRAKTSDINPVLQIVCCRGKTTDIEHTIFNRAIVRGFAHGLFSLYEVMAESRTGAKSLELQKDPLAETEYFNRQMQLICSSLCYLDAYWQHNTGGTYHLVDCGTTRTCAWPVEKENFNDVVGSHYVVEGGLATVTKNDTHLIGKLIQLRTPLTCAHPEPNHICAACYGEMEFSLPAGTNVAHFACIVLCSAISQKVLSVKHNEVSAATSVIEIAAPYKKWLHATNKGIGVALALDVSNTTLVVNKKDVPRLSDIYETKDVRDLSPRKIGAMDYVTIQTEIPGLGLTSDYVPVKAGTSASNFTHGFLKYMKDVGFESDENFIYVKLEGWSSLEPIWELSQKHANMLDFMEAIKKLVKVGDEDKKDRLTMDLTDGGNVSQALLSFYELVSSKFQFNVSQLATIMRSTLVTDAAAGDYSIPSGDQVGQFEEFGRIMEKRSISGAVANERHGSIFTSFDSFLNVDRSAHPMDENIQPTPSYYP